MSRRVPIVLYGATGYTGRLMAAELARREIPMLLAGRSRDKLEALSATLPTKPQVLVADASDPASLQGMAARGQAVLSAAGPFASLGPPVQEACLKAGSHFLDITGETPYMLDTWSRDSRWREAGLAAVNAVGFDVVPTDVAAWLAADGLDRVDELDIAIWVGGEFGASQGTQRSLVNMLGSESQGYEDGQWRPTPAGSFTREMDFGGRVGPRSVLFVPIGDIATAPRTTGARTVRTYFAVKSPTQAKIGGGIMRLSGVGIVRQALGSGPAQRLLASLVARGEEGPSDERRAAARFAVVAEARGAGQTRTVRLTGKDPYGLTAVTSVEIARRVAAGPPRTGALSPSQAIGDVRSFLPTLSAFGVDIDEG